MSEQPCSRCGRSHGLHVGYHEDIELLPYKKGDRVRVKAGAEISTTLPNPDKKRFTLTKSRVVTIHSFDCGMSECKYDSNGREYFVPLDDPGICWVGTGGYWHHAKLTDVELVNHAEEKR